MVGDLKDRNLPNDKGNYRIAGYIGTVVARESTRAALRVLSLFEVRVSPFCRLSSHRVTDGRFDRLTKTI